MVIFTNFYWTLVFGKVNTVSRPVFDGEKNDDKNSDPDAQIWSEIGHFMTISPTTFYAPACPRFFYVYFVELDEAVLLRYK